MKLQEIQSINKGFLTDPADIKEWIKKHVKTLDCEHVDEDRLNIHEDGTVDIHREIGFGTSLDEVCFTGIHRFDVKFDFIAGSVSFDPKSCTLTSLEGCPQRISGSFVISKVLGSQIKNMIGGPISVKSLYSIEYCPDITSMAGIPADLEDSLGLIGTGIESFDGVPRNIRYLDITDSYELKSIVGIEHTFPRCHTFLTTRNQIKHGGIGALLIGDFAEIGCLGAREGWMKIINSYAHRRDDIFECQAELIAAGYEAHAQL